MRTRGEGEKSENFEDTASKSYAALATSNLKKSQILRALPLFPLTLGRQFDSGKDGRSGRPARQIRRECPPAALASFEGRSQSGSCPDCSFPGGRERGREREGEREKERERERGGGNLDWLAGRGRLLFPKNSESSG